MNLQLTHYIGIIATAGIVILISFLAMQRVTRSDEFLLGKKDMGVPGIAGILLGTILGGASTVGTAQMAFAVGISGILFTLGCATGLVVLSIFLSKLEKIHKITTIPQILCRRYGRKARPVTGLISIFGIFFSIVASTLSMGDVLSAIFSTTIPITFIILFLLVLFYVLFGGMLGATWVGLFKTIVLYVILIISGYVTLGGLFGEPLGYLKLPEGFLMNWAPKGWGLMLSSYFSAIIGVISTQTYLQAYFPARSLNSARKGYWVSAILVLPVGILSVCIGLFMRAFHPELMPTEAVPYFIFHYLPPGIGGVGAAILILAGLGTSAGLTMGLTTIVLKDMIEIWKSDISEEMLLWYGRIFILFIGILSVGFSYLQYGSQILTWNYLSLGLRGAGVCLPLIAALYFPRKFDSRLVVLSMGISTFVVLFFQFFTSAGLLSLWFGLLVSLLFLLLAYWKRQSKRKRLF